MEPTATTYAELRLAYEHFNATLFGGQLPDCLLTLQREKRTYGYFSAARFGNREGQTTDEIAMNPEYFAVIPLIEILQTLAHEMCHLWQAHFGTPGRGRYHNHEWADKMEGIGLMPSDTGQPGGRRVGDRMADYVIPGGRFSAEVSQLLVHHDFAVTWYDRFTPAAPLHPVATASALWPMVSAGLAVPAEQGVLISPQLPPASAPNRSNRDKYTCPGCRMNVWGKPALRIACVSCGLELVSEACAPVDDEPAPGRTRLPARAPNGRRL